MPTPDTPSGMARAALRTLLLCDLVDSTRLIKRLGDQRASELFQQHDRLARDLLVETKGQEIDKTDGFLLLFERPSDAVQFALAYHRGLIALHPQGGEAVPLRARVGIHVGEVFLRENSPEDIARGAKPLEVEGLAKPTVARLASLAESGQTLLTRSAFDLARRAAVGGPDQRGEVQWLAHGTYTFKGVDEPLEVFEVGIAGGAPLHAPLGSDKARRFEDEDDILGWRPARGQEVPERPNWILRQRLGEGGFGDVWLAEQTKTHERRVFKFCYQAAQLQALKREVTIFRLLKETLGNRRDIARILDWNFGDAPYFLEAEYSEGGDLKQWAQGRGGLGEVSLEERLEIGIQIAEALAAAHSVGVLHKDVKPANILIAESAEGPRVQLTDFGIGQILDPGRLVDQGITVLGQTVLGVDDSGWRTGTPMYIAPEVAGGQPATVQADLYAFGVILYQLIVGDLNRVLAPGWERGIDDELLREDIARLVDGSPERRPADAQWVAEQLRKLPERRLQREKEQEEKRMAERGRRRRRVLLVASIALAAFAIAMVFHARRISQEVERANREAATAREVSQFLEELFEVSDPGIARGDDITARELLDRGAERITKELTDQPLTQARLMHTIGRIYRELGNWPKAEEMLEQALVLRRQHLPEGHPEIGETLSDLARLKHVLTHNDEAEALYLQALAIQEAALAPDDPALVKTLQGLGIFYAITGRSKEAEPLLLRAQEIHSREGAGNPLELARVQRQLALLYKEAGRYDEAKVMGDRAAKLFATIDQAATDKGWLYQTMAHLEFVLGHYSEAEKLARRSREVWTPALGADHLLVAWGIGLEAACLIDLGRSAEAEPLLQGAMERDHGPHVQGFCLFQMAKIQEERGEFGDAEATFRQALALLEDDLGRDDWLVAETRARLAEFLLAHGSRDQRAEAESLALEAVAIYRRAIDPKHPQIAWLLRVAGDVHRAQGKAAEAEAEYREALEIAVEKVGENHPAILPILGGLVALGGPGGDFAIRLRRLCASLSSTPHPYHSACE